MSGANLKIKAGQTLFKEGDPSDGMYLIRHGELTVSLEKNGNVITLANLKAGAMLGEMSFFDKRPRSATVKAVTDSEVTKISNEDFTKLLKQVPKWFVSIMTSLSSRLRETNERVQGLEAELKGFVNPLRDLAKFLNVLSLLWHKDGVKEGKAWELAKEESLTQMTGLLGQSKAMIQRYVQACEEGRLFHVRKSQYNSEVFSIAQRAHVEKAAAFLTAFVKAFPDAATVPADTVVMLEVLNRMVQAQGYETVSIPFEDVATEAARQGIKPHGFTEALAFLKMPLEGLALVKMSSGVGFKTTKKDLPALVDLFRLVQASHKITL